MAPNQSRCPMSDIQRLRSFSQPCHLQGQSRLMTLPIEVRIMILRTLLCSNNPLDVPKAPLPSQETFGYKCEFHQPSRMPPGRIVEFGLAPVVLRLCQILYEDGWAILYGNTLVIKLQDGWRNWPSGPTSIFVATPPVAIEARRHLSAYVPAFYGCIAIPDDILGKTQALHELVDSQLEALIPRFNRFMIHVRRKSQNRSYVIWRWALADLLHPLENGNVEVRFEETPTWDCTEAPHGLYLDAFRTLRCKTFKFIHSGVDEPLASRLNSITAVVTGGDPVVCLDYRRSTCEYLLDRCYKKHPSDDPFRSEGLKVADRLQRADINSDLEEFNAAEDAMFDLLGPEFAKYEKHYMRKRDQPEPQFLYRT